MVRSLANRTFQLSWQLFEVEPGRVDRGIVRTPALHPRAAAVRSFWQRIFWRTSPKIPDFQRHEEGDDKNSTQNPIEAKR